MDIGEAIEIVQKDIIEDWKNKRNIKGYLVKIKALETILENNKQKDEEIKQLKYDVWNL